MTGCITTTTRGLDPGADDFVSKPFSGEFTLGDVVVKPRQAEDAEGGN